MSTLDHLAEALAKAPAFPEDLQPEEEGSYRCPVCDGEGTVDGEWIAHAQSHSWAGGVQFYGIGHEHGWAEEFYLAARTHLPALLEIARAAEVAIAARQGATFAEWVAVNDALAAALAKLNPKGTT